jgi:PAS domain-containing protein
MRVLAQAALVEANRVLEKRVADRTMALRESNESLRKDIVARAEAERALAESEERFHHLADLSSDWYWEQDENFRFTMMSRSAGTIINVLARPGGRCQL